MKVDEAIGQYRLTGLIGRGGMGAVYAGEHVLLGRPAAIKVLLPELCVKQDDVTRFFNEARAAAAIRHPGIVEIYDFGWSDSGIAYLVMERLDGEPLSRRIARGALPWPTALSLTRQIAGALGAAHARGIVHRDLKPDNIFVVSDPEVPGGERIKLLDFGIAKLAGDPTAAQVTRTGAVMGTPTYMAPEQCRGISIDHRADLYSLGCVLFELCTGRTVFTGEGVGDVLAAHIHTPPPKLTSRSPSIPGDVEALVERLLTKSPANRIQTADDLIDEIDILLDKPGRAETIPDPPFTSTQPSLKSTTTLSGAVSTLSANRAGTRRALAVATGLALVACAAVVAVFVGIETTRESSTESATRSASVPSPPEPTLPPPQPATQPALPAVPTPPAPEIQPLPVPELPPEVALVIKTKPAGAELWHGEKRLGRTPFRGAIKRGDSDVTLTLKLRGYHSKRFKIQPDVDISTTVELTRLTARSQPVEPSRDKAVDPDKSINPF